MEKGKSKEEVLHLVRVVRKCMMLLRGTNVVRHRCYYLSLTRQSTQHIPAMEKLKTTLCW